MRRKKPQEMKRTNIDQKNQKKTKEKINKLERKKKEKRMKKDKIRRKKIKSRKAKKSAEKNKGRKKRKQGKGKNGKKMTWSWTSLNPPVSRRKTHPLHVRYAGDSKGLSWQNCSRGVFPSLSPFFPLFPPSMAKIFPQPCALRDDTDRPNETWMKPMKRMKHERKANETNETWIKHAASTITTGVSAARSSRCRNCDGCFDFHCRFPTSLSCSSWLCKNAQGWPRWPGVAAEFVVVCEARVRGLYPNSVSTSWQSEPALATGTPHQQTYLVPLTFHRPLAISCE